MSSTDFRLMSLSMSMSESSYSSHSRSHSLGGSQALTLPADLPPIRPLDLGPLMHSHELTHAELARTVDDLQKWMSIVEVGLVQMLDRAAQDQLTIEEEAEDGAMYDRFLQGRDSEPLPPPDGRTAASTPYPVSVMPE